ncbi:hypothetical protein G5644_22765 [Serratia marcescens]|nr:hypothetical protein [Serratia marcescens]
MMTFQQQKARSGFPERASLNMAPLTGIAFAFKWLISKLNLNCDAVKTTKMTTNRRRLHKSKKLRGIVDHFE